MIPGPALILTCPYCGTHKAVLSLRSGNTFGQKLWSDNKSIAPMLPRVSFVQKCPSCGGFFLMSRQESEPKYGKKPSFNKGDLSYLELKKAWNSLKNTPDLTDDEKLGVLIMQVWAYNDQYTRDAVKPAPEEEQQYIRDIIDMLLALDSVDDLLKAELLRETGRFEESMSLINGYSTEDEFLQRLLNRLKEENLASNTRPFLISDLF